MQLPKGTFQEMVTAFEEQAHLFHEEGYTYLQLPELGLQFAAGTSADFIFNLLVRVFGSDNVRKQMDGDIELWRVTTEGENLGPGYYFHFFDWDCVYFILSGKLEVC